MSGPAQRGVGPDEAFFQRAPALCLVGGFDGYFKQVNPAFTRALGWPESEALKIHYLELTHPDDAAPAEAAFSDLVAGHSISISARARHKDGSYRWTEWVSRPDPNDDLIYSVGRDVTERRTEQEKRGLDARLHVLFDRSPLGIAIADDSGHILEVNDTLCALLGYSRADLTGRELASVFDEAGRDRHVAASRQMLAGEASSYESNERVLRADGGWSSARLEVDLVREGSGSPLYFVSHWRAVGDRVATGDGATETTPTPRELEVLQLAAQGLSTEEMGARLVISPTTVKTHLQNLYAKLGVSNRAAAVAEALRRGLI